MSGRRHPTESGPFRFLDRVGGLVGNIPVWVVVLVAGTGIAALAVLGILQRVRFPLWRFANLDSEASAGKWFSSGLLWAAAGCWLLAAAGFRTARAWPLVWAAALGWLAADEGNAIHERLERWLGIDWQVLYLPVIVLVAAAWWRVTMRQGRDPAVRMPMVLGAVLWGIALVLEPVQNWGGSPASAAVYDSTMLIEEVAEMLASTAFLIAAVRVLAGRSGGAGSSVSDPPQAV